MHVICVIFVILTLREKISRGGNACNIRNIDFVEKISRGGNACNICNIDVRADSAEGVMHVICVIW